MAMYYSYHWISRIGLYIPDRYPDAAPRWDPTAADPPLASDSTWAAPQNPPRTGSLEVLETGMDHMMHIYIYIYIYMYIYIYIYIYHTDTSTDDRCMI